jgi:hypothetical protein
LRESRKGDWLWAVWLVSLLACAYLIPRSEAWAYAPLIGLIFGIVSEEALGRFSERHRENDLAADKWLLWGSVFWTAALLLDVGLDGYEKAIRGKFGAFIWPVLLTTVIIQTLKVRKQLIK